MQGYKMVSFDDVVWNEGGDERGKEMLLLDGMERKC